MNEIERLRAEVVRLDGERRAARCEVAAMEEAVEGLREALRALYRICCNCDLEVEAERPTEEQYNAAMDAAEAALAATGKP